MVTRFRRLGVNQENRRLTSQILVPEAADPLTIAAAMHWTHMR